jgi:segregation and condensation protein A
MVNVKLNQFEGPLDLLLQLIEKNELDISTLALSDITEQYLGTLERVQQLHPDELADFLVVAAKLLYIKSKVLLPQLVLAEDEGISLEDQLRLYKTFVTAAEGVKKLFRKRHVMYGREHTALIAPTFSPPKHVHLEDLHAVFCDILKKLEPLFVIPESVIIRTISIQERIQSIRELVQKHVTLNFGKLLETATSRTEIIVTFLALLELVKQRTAIVVQDGNFTDIHIEHVASSASLNQ